MPSRSRLLGEIRRLLSEGGTEQVGRSRCAPMTTQAAGPRQGEHRPSRPRQPTHEGKLMNDQPTELDQSRHPIEGSAREACPRHRHRQRAFDRLWLCPGLPPARGRPRRHLPQREGPALCRASRQGARGIDLRALRRGPRRRARSRLPADPRDLGQPRHRAPFHRVRAEGGPAGAAPRQFRRGVQGGDGHLLPLLHPHGAARRAA